MQQIHSLCLKAVHHTTEADNLVLIPPMGPASRMLRQHCNQGQLPAAAQTETVAGTIVLNLTLNRRAAAGAAPRTAVAPRTKALKPIREGVQLF